MLRVLLTLSFIVSPVCAQTSAVKQFAPPLAHPSKADCGCEINLPADVLATVNGVRISTAEIDEPLQPQLDALRQQVIAARTHELDLQINSRLLEAAAKRRGITAQKLIDEVILAPVKAPTEAEAQTFYEQNKARLPGEFKAVKEELIAYLLGQRQREAAGKYAAELRAAAQVQIHVKDISPPLTPADGKRVLATVNGQPVTTQEIETSLQPLIARVQEEMYKLRHNELTLRINDTLLQQEAQKQKLTPMALLKAALKAQATPVTDAEAQKFYAENKERVSGEWAQVKDQIRQYLQQREERRVEEALAARLRTDATIQVFLTMPEAPVFTIATDDQPTKGNAAAAVTMVEFTDFQCPSCAQAQPVLEQVLKDFDGQVKLVVRDFPLEKHAAAFKAAEAAEAARAQGKYWEYSTLLWQSQAALNPEKLKHFAVELKLNATQFNAALDAGTFANQVQRDVQDGWRLGVNGTPTLFVNGRRVAEPSYAALKAAIEAALAEAGKN
jgi:protein-disulfide isomerase